MGIFGICRPEDFHLWYDSAVPGWFVLLTILALAIPWIVYLICCKCMRRNILSQDKLRKKNIKKGGDECSRLQPEIFNFERLTDLTYADFERECCIKSNKRKQLEYK